MKRLIDDLAPGERMPNAAKPKTGRLAPLKSRRKLWLSVRLYLGLLAGLLLAVVGLTGGILVFYQEMQEVWNPELSIVSVPVEGQGKLQPLDSIEKCQSARKPVF